MKMKVLEKLVFQKKSFWNPIHTDYQISSYKTRGYYSFNWLLFKDHSTLGQRSQYINVQVLLECRNYSMEGLM